MSVQPASVEVVDPQFVAALLELSDERDLWLRRLLAAEREAYRRGYEDGRGDGYRDGYSHAVTDWKVTAAGMTKLAGPTFAELDRRRYPPDGRLSWIQDSRQERGTA